MFKVEFNVPGREKPVSLYAEDVDTTSPLVMTLKNLRKEHRSGLLTLPDEDYEEFSKLEFVTFPVHALAYFGRVKDEAEHKIVPLTAVE